jgi:hypothetical protein
MLVFISTIKLGARELLVNEAGTGLQVATFQLQQGFMIRN